MIFNREPAVILAFIGAAVALAVGFGLRVSGEQVNLIMVFAAAGITLLTGVVTRSQVVPNVVADKQIEVAKASDVTRSNESIIKEAKETA